jgi:hypothetical protein
VNAVHTTMPMKSDVIRYEIDRTTAEINQVLLILVRRGRDARAQITRWIPLAVVAGAFAVCAAGVATTITIQRRFRRRAQQAQRFKPPPVGMV